MPSRSAIARMAASYCSGVAPGFAAIHARFAASYARCCCWGMVIPSPRPAVPACAWCPCARNARRARPALLHRSWGRLRAAGPPGESPAADSECACGSTGSLRRLFIGLRRLARLPRNDAAHPLDAALGFPQGAELPPLAWGEAQTAYYWFFYGHARIVILWTHYLLAF